MNIARPIIKRHPFSDRRELNTKTVRERNGWIETANMHSKNEFFWRDRCDQRCSADGHTFVRQGDGGGNYCTCCGKVDRD